ncbi:570_t:CDS:2, partial [Funneliformis geosporum]
MNENNSNEDLQEILSKKQLQQQKINKSKEEYNHEDLQETPLNKQQYQLQKEIQRYEKLQEIPLKKRLQQKKNKHQNDDSDENLQKILPKKQKQEHDSSLINKFDNERHSGRLSTKLQK